MNVDWSQAARRDILRITAFYRTIDPQLSIAMRLRIEAALAHLFVNPRIVPRIIGSTRKWRIKKTPLLLFFILDARNMVVKAVKHEREDWLSKL